MMKTNTIPYVIARNTDDGRVEYWTGAGWTFDSTAAKAYRTLQAVDKAGAKIESDRMLYTTEAGR